MPQQLISWGFFCIIKLYLLPICSQRSIKVYRKRFYSNFKYSLNSALFYTREILSSSPLSLPLQTPTLSQGGGDTWLHLAKEALHKGPPCTASVFQRDHTQYSCISVKLATLYCWMCQAARGKHHREVRSWEGVRVQSQ